MTGAFVTSGHEVRDWAALGIALSASAAAAVNAWVAWRREQRAEHEHTFADEESSRK